MDINKEFPSFPLLEATLVDLLNKYGFTKNSSWHNDTCPSAMTENQRWQIYLDHPVRELREIPSFDRFSLFPLDENGEVIDNRQAIFTTEDLDELATALEDWSNPEITATIRSLDNDEKPEVHTFRAAEAIQHYGETRTWLELGFDQTHQHAQQSLAEDYALWTFKRQYGDDGNYEVDVDFDSPCVAADASSEQAEAPAADDSEALATLRAEWENGMSVIAENGGANRSSLVVVLKDKNGSYTVMTYFKIGGNWNVSCDACRISADAAFKAVSQRANIAWV